MTAVTERVRMPALSDALTAIEAAADNVTVVAVNGSTGPGVTAVTVHIRETGVQAAAFLRCLAEGVWWGSDSEGREYGYAWVPAPAGPFHLAVVCLPGVDRG